MKKKIVKIGEMFVSNDPEDVLITYSLGSCLGVAAYDRDKKIGGLIHCMLPFKSSEKEATEKPAMFVETGIPLLLNTMLRLGAIKRNISIKVAGCANMSESFFEIGRKNYLVLRKILWKNNLLIDAELIGGKVYRNLKIYIKTGKVIVSSNGIEVELSKDKKLALNKKIF